MRRTLAGDTRIDLGDVLGEAWRRTAGSKRILAGGLALFYVALLPLAALLSGVLTGLGVDPARGVGGLVLQLALAALVYPFLAGVFMVALRRVRDRPIAFRQLLDHYDRVPAIVALNVLASLGISLGLVLLIVPGIYLAVAWSMALPLLVDRHMGVLEALECSRRLVTRHWFTVFGFSLISLLGVTAGVLTLGIAFVWIVPWLALAWAVLYRELAGAADDGGYGDDGGGDGGGGDALQRLDA